MKTRASRWHAIAYPRASAIAYLPAHQISKCIPPVLIHRAINYDSSSSKSLEGVVWQSKKGTQNPTFWPLVTPRYARGQTFCTTVFYSSLHLIWYATWLCLYKMDFGPFGITPAPPPGPAPRGYIKISNMFLQSSSIRAIACESFEILA